MGKFIIKSEAERLVFGEVYLPNVPDADNEFMTAETIQKMAYEFMKRGEYLFDAKHDNAVRDVQIVESFIARKGDEVFAQGAWVLGVYIADDKLWEDIQKGRANGFSFEGMATKVEKEVKLEVSNTRKGETSEAEGHTHTLTVRYSEDGKFLGGETDEVDGHSHSIRTGTATEISKGHSHRFARVDGVSILVD